ncbi:MAG: hypothetical protein U1F11_12615 [Steroidobacteraceae bacterium]
MNSLSCRAQQLAMLALHVRPASIGRFAQLALEVTEVLAGEAWQQLVRVRRSSRAVAARAGTRVGGLPRCELATGAGAGRRLRLQRGRIGRDVGDVPRALQVAAIREVFHAQVAALLAAHVDELLDDDALRLRADRRHGAVGDAAAVGTMAGRAGCVQRCTARRITRLRQRLRQFRDRARGRECRRAAEQRDRTDCPCQILARRPLHRDVTGFSQILRGL